MSLSDLFFPGNPERRKKLICRSLEIRDLISNNCRATNQLTDVLNKYLGLSFSHISLDENITAKENCEKIINHIHQIQAEVEKIDQKLKEKLEPTLYEKLINTSLSTPELKNVMLDLGIALIGGPGILLIGQPIAGAIERDQLEKALKEYDQVLKEFKPASEEYQDKITSVKARLEIMMEDEENK